MFYHDPHSASVPGAYNVRQVVIRSLNHIRGTDIYARAGEDEWSLIKEVKSHIKGATRINLRATGDAVRVIPKAYALSVITKVEVFPVPE